MCWAEATNKHLAEKADPGPWEQAVHPHLTLRDLWARPFKILQLLLGHQHPHEICLAKLSKAFLLIKIKGL